MEVQRLLFLLEAPEYCMRAFREHGVNGQDLLHMQDDDLDDSRFKFPRHVQRKVLRIAEAWRCFQALTGAPTQCSLSLERFMDAHSSAGRHPESLSQLQAAFLALDVNDNGYISFEDFLVGYTLLEAAGVTIGHPAAPATTAFDAAAAVAGPRGGDGSPAAGGSAGGGTGVAAPAEAAGPSPSAVCTAGVLAGGSGLLSSWAESWFRL